MLDLLIKNASLPDGRTGMSIAVQGSKIVEVTQGLDAPGSGRRWLIYSLGAASQAELKQIQNFIKTARASQQPKGGSLSVGVEQDSLIVNNPALSDTRWETWLQTAKQEGFFEVWSGTPAQLLKLAADAKK